MPSVAIPIPHEDFDPTEVAVPWKVLKREGFEPVFATPDGRPGRCDPLSLEGVVFKQIGAKPDAVAAYRELEHDSSFRKPLAYEELQVGDFAGLHLPGGHAPGMKSYLESETLQAKVVDFFVRNLPVSAICHGPVVLARTIDPRSRMPVIRGRRMTALTKFLERSGYLLTLWAHGRRFRTYPRYVQDEVIDAVGDPDLFETGPRIPSYSNPFTVTDGNLVTARWPGDAAKLAADFVARLRTS